jgi:SRSO17 transposase
VLPALLKRDTACQWIIDDTGFAKKGTHSVGVGRQYCGRLGKTDNCQVAVSLSIANDQGSLPVAYQLYLPQDWANDPTRRKRLECQRRLNFAPRVRLRWNRFSKRLPQAYRTVSYWPMRPMGRKLRGVTNSAPGA